MLVVIPEEVVIESSVNTVPRSYTYECKLMHYYISIILITIQKLHYVVYAEMNIVSQINGYSHTVYFFFIKHVVLLGIEPSSKVGYLNPIAREKLSLEYPSRTFPYW
jgi:hypothetical protein